MENILDAALVGLLSGLFFLALGWILSAIKKIFDFLKKKVKIKRDEKQSKKIL